MRRGRGCATSPSTAPRRHVALVALSVVIVGIVLGWVLHTDEGGAVFAKYSRHHAAFLFLALAIAGGALAYGWCHRDRTEESLRRIGHAVWPTFAFMAVAAPSLYIYAHNRYLQSQVFSLLGAEAHAFQQIDEPFYPQVAAVRGAGTYRIFCLGGSTTLGVGLPWQQAYPARLEALLRERYPAANVEVVNAGCTWHTSQHSLFKYLTRVAAYRPDMVIVYHAFNDLFQATSWKLGNGPFRSDYGHFFGALGNRVKPVDRFNRRLAEFLVPRHWYTDLRHTLPPPVPQPVDLRAPLPSFRRNLQRLAQVCQADGVRVVIANQPFLYRDNMTQEEEAVLFYPYYYGGSDARPTVAEQRQAMVVLNRTVEDVARTNGLPFVDLEGAIPKRLEFMYDDVHYTALGAQRVAETFAAGIDWQGVFSRADSGRAARASP